MEKLQLLIKRYHREISLVTGGFFAGVFVLGAIMIYESTSFERLKEKHQVLVGKNKSLATELAEKEVELQVLKNSELVTRQTLQDQHEEIAELEKLVDFYRQLMAPTDAKSGLDLNSYTFEALNSEGLYRYKLTFVQYAKKHRLLKADLTARIEGLSQEQLVSLDFSELVGKDGQVTERLRFKYFQVLEGELQLPSDFKPQTIELEAKVISKKNEQWRRSLPWKTLET